MKIAARATLLMASAVGISLAASLLFLTASQAQDASNVKPAVNAASADAAWEMEFTAWRNASKAGKAGDYEAYLKAYPDGKFAKVAKSRLETMMAKTNTNVGETPAEATAEVAPPAAEPAMAAEEPPAEEPAAEPAMATEEPAAPAADWQQEFALWTAAAQGNTVAEYQSYLDSYPKGKFAAIADSRIALLQAAEKPVAGVAEGDENPPADTEMAEQPQTDDQAQGNEQQQANSDDSQQQPLMMGTTMTEEASLDRDTRAEMQGRLSSLGYDTAGADGDFGPRSRSAISDWQEANKAPVSGYLSNDQIDFIRQQSDQSYNEWLNARPAYVPPRIVRERIIIRRPIIVEEIFRPRIVVRRPVVVVRRPAVVVRRPVIVIGAGKAVPRNCINKHGQVKRRCR